MNGDALVYDMEQRRPACPLLQAALGGNPSFAHEWDSRVWIIDGDLSRLRRYGPVTLAQVRKIAEQDGGQARAALKARGT